MNYVRYYNKTKKRHPTLTLLLPLYKKFVKNYLFFFLTDLHEFDVDPLTL